MSNPINVNGQSDFNDQVLKSDIPVLVDFWAPWCGPCQMMAPILESLAAKLDSKLKIVKIDTETTDNQALAYHYQIRSIPNLKLFKNGQVVQEFVGFRPESTFLAELEPWLAP